MNVEAPPITDKVLSSYLIRAFNAVKSTIDSIKPFIVNSSVKNPTLGRFYLAQSASSQFDSAGMYYYNGNAFLKLAEVSGATLELGILHTQAFYGDFGQLAYEHIGLTNNPHNVTKEQVGLPLVDNTADIDKPVSNATYAELNNYVLKTVTINSKPLSANVQLTTADIPPTVNRRYLTNAEYSRVNTAASATADGYLKSTDWTVFNGKQDALGFTPEDVANKKTVMAGNESSNTFYLSAKSVYDWATGLFVPLTRTLTINGTGYDLSADRSWTIATGGISDAPNDANAYVRSGLTWVIGYTKTAIDTLLGSKVDSNSSITGATKTKVTYDSKGLITSGADATTSDISEGSNLYFTEARVRNAIATGLSAAAGTLSASDSLIQLFNKIAGLIDNDAWITSFTPTVASLTKGNGTEEFRYKRIGKTLFCEYKFTLGSTSAMGASLPLYMNLPFAIKASYANNQPVGTTSFYDASAALVFNGYVLTRNTSSADAVKLCFGTTLGSRITMVGNPSTTAPFTWAVGDIIYAEWKVELA